ncbi:MAG TPA: VTT domain-containing protein [Hyphomicrobiaceae bacterium]|nr:VTT domain-containing protein [Hyphomicrobiaceae bacterium]
MTLPDVAPYVGLALWAFLAATLLPLSSEAGLWAGITQGQLNPGGLFLAATVGNVAGALLNWWLGTRLARYDGSWTPLKPATIAAARERFLRWGTWSLLFSWVPIVGDPLTFVAGLLGVPLKIFFPLVAIGKAARYLAIVWGAA